MSPTIALIGNPAETRKWQQQWALLPEINVHCLAPGDRPPESTSPLFFDIHAPQDDWRKAFGAILKKRMGICLSLETPLSTCDLTWLKRLVKGNRLHLSLTGSLRYHPFLARLRELRMTGIFNAPVTITATCPFPDSGVPPWSWLDACLWLLDGGDVRIENSTVVIRQTTGTATLSPGECPSIHLVSPNGEATWTPEGLQTNVRGLQRNLILPPYRIQAELGCRCKELITAGEWIVFPTKDVLALLEYYSRLSRLGDPFLTQF